MVENEEWFDFEKCRKYFLLEQQRIESYRDWPFDETSPCSIAKMSEAGFYWNGNDRDVDTASCFVCGKTLDGWEATDDPWKEHSKHAPQCMFVKLGKKENDLTVEEFLQLFCSAARTYLSNCYEKKKKDINSLVRAEINRFMDKQ